MDTKKKIMVSKDHIEMLAAAHHCSTGSVYGALAYRSDSQTAQVIREQAIKEHGGVVVELPRFE